MNSPTTRQQRYERRKRNFIAKQLLEDRRWRKRIKPNKHKRKRQKEIEKSFDDLYSY